MGSLLFFFGLSLIVIFWFGGVLGFRGSGSLCRGEIDNFIRPLNTEKLGVATLFLEVPAFW